MISDAIKLVDINYISERTLQILVTINNIRLAITNCYAPTNEAKDSQKDKFYRDLQKCMKDTPMQYKIVLAGDFNATIGEESFGTWKCLGPTNK